MSSYINCTLHFYYWYLYLILSFIQISARLGWTDDIDFDLNGDLTNNSYLNKYVVVFESLFKKIFYKFYPQLSMAKCRSWNFWTHESRAQRNLNCFQPLPIENIFFAIFYIVFCFCFCFSPFWFCMAVPTVIPFYHCHQHWQF